MSAPWEDFQQTNSVPPWIDFQRTKPNISPVLQQNQTGGEIIRQGSEPSMMDKVKNYFSTQSPYGSIGYDVAKTTEDLSGGFHKLFEPAPSIEAMPNTTGKALLEQLTPANIGLATGAGPVVKALQEGGVLGKAGLAYIISKFAKTGAEQAGTEFGTVFGTPPPTHEVNPSKAVFGAAGLDNKLTPEQQKVQDEIDYHKTLGVISALQALPALGARQIGESLGRKAPPVDDFNTKPSPNDAPQPMQLPERSQTLIDQKKAEAQGKLNASQNLPAGQGFVAGAKGVVSADNAFKKAELTRPIAFIEDTKQPEPVAEKSSPPFIAGATTVTGEKGVTPVTKEQLELHSGVPFPKDEDEARLAFGHNLVSLSYAMRGGDKEHAQELWQQNEKIKNQFFKGQTPSEVSDEELRGYRNSFHSGPDVDWKKIRGAIGLGDDEWTHQGVKIAMTDSGFKSIDSEVDAGQLKNRVMNKLGVESAEGKLWKAQGIDSAFKSGEKSTPEKLAKWMQENGPKVEVRTFGGESQDKVLSEQRQRAVVAQNKQNEAQHKLETMGYHLDAHGSEVIKNGERIQASPLTAYAYDMRRENLLWQKPIEELPQEVQDYFKANHEYIALGRHEPGEVANTYQSIAPKDKPVSVVMVRVPVKPGYQSKAEQMSGDNWKTKEQTGILHQGHHFGSEDRNVLGWARIQYEDTPKGKVAHVIEVQSDWGQQVREQKSLLDKANDPSARQQAYSAAGVKDHPFLPQSNRLVLKAAIAEARKNGATHIAISDAETAMMTEGHDRMGVPADSPLPYNEGMAKEMVADHRIDEDLVQDAKETGYFSFDTTPQEADYYTKLAHKYGIDWPPKEPTQSGGMRLNYDKILPQIAEELTGTKGERVELGEHRKAMEHRHEGDEGPELDAQGNVIEPGITKARKDLIFRNPDGTSKTSTTARIYPIEKVAKKIESGEPPSIQGKLYSGVPLPDMEAIKDLSKKLGSFIRGDKAHGTLAAFKDATSNLVTKNANEAASRISGMLERQTGSKPKKNSVESQALLFQVESENDLGKLERFKQQLEAAKNAPKKDRGEALYAVNYAIKNFNKLKPVAEEYSKLTESEAKWEEKSGRTIERRKGYVMHLAEDEGDNTSFVHKREYDTMVDRIVAGREAGSLDAVELMRARVARGQRAYVQSQVFINNAKALRSKEGKPIIAEEERVERGEGQQPDIRAPKGYKMTQVGYNKVPVLDGFADTLHALTSPSWFLQSATGRAVMEARGVGKYFTLGLDTFHLFRVGGYGMAAKAGTLNTPSLRYRMGVTILDNSTEELKDKAKAGQIDAKKLPEMLEAKRRLDLGIKAGFNIGRVVDMFNQHWTDKTPVLGTFQRFLFNTFQRGVMADVYAKAWDSYKAQMPKATDNAIAKQLSKDLNDVFGTRGRQGIIKSRTGQDAASLLFLAPQWTEGRIFTEGKAYANVGTAAYQLAKGERPQINMQARVVGSLILMYFLGNQVINYATTGHSTLENEEGHELDAFIPDKISGSEGYYLNPTANAAEVTHAMENSLKREGGDAWEAWLDFVGGRLSTVAKPVTVGVWGKQYGMTGPDVPPWDGRKRKFGEQPSGYDKAIAGVKDLVPSPIGGAEALKAMGGSPDASVEKQFLSRFGAKVDYARPSGKKNIKSKSKFIK